MAAILPFKRQEPRGRRTSHVASGKATIIIFPGVRYERRTEANAKKLAARELKPKPKPYPA